MSNQIIKALGGVEDLLLGNALQVQRRGATEVEINGLCAESMPRAAADGETTDEAISAIEVRLTAEEAKSTMDTELAAGMAYTYTDIGTADAYVLDYTYVIQELTALFNGMIVRFSPANTNTGPATLQHPLQQIAVPITTQNGAALLAEDILANETIEVEWNVAADAYRLTVFRGITETSIQTAEHLTVTSTGTASALIAVPLVAWPDLTKNRELLLTFHVAPIRDATLVVNSTAAKPIKRSSTTGALIAIHDGDIRAQHRYTVTWNVANDCYIIQGVQANQLVRNYAVWDAAGTFRSQTLNMGTVMDHGIGDFSIQHNVPSNGTTYPNASAARDSVVVSGVVKEFESASVSTARLKMSDLALDSVISETSVRVNTVNDVGPIDPEWVAVVIHGGGEQ